MPTAQALKDLQTPDTPLVLKAQGSFFVGGEKVEQTQGELGDLGPGGHIAVNQMYVRYMVPQGGDGNVPGRDGAWRDPDRQVLGDHAGRADGMGRILRAQGPSRVRPGPGGARAVGLQSSRLQQRARGLGAAGQSSPVAAIQRRGRLAELPLRLEAGAAVPGQPVPADAVDELVEAGRARTSALAASPLPTPTLKALADLAGQLNGAVLMGHSQSGSFPLEAALLNPAADERARSRRAGPLPGQPTPTSRSPALAKVPILVVFGDHRDTPTGLPTLPRGRPVRGCQALISRLKAAGGQAEMLSPAETRHPRQQPHDHAGQEQPADRRPDPAVDRRARHQARRATNEPRDVDAPSLRRRLGLLPGPVAGRAARAPGAAATPRLALELQDYAALPITADNTNENTRAQLARVNYLRDEPGGRRFFVNDLNGPLYILDKQTKTFTTYLDFNGAGGRPGLFPKFTFARNFATGLTNVIFDPDYARNGVFYTLHMEDPPTPRSAAPREPGSSPGLDLTGTRRRPPSRRRRSTARSIARSCSSNGRIGMSRTPPSKARPGSSCACSIRWRRIRWAR